MKYDRAITTFSADGRLQQVEYGMEAANRGDSVVAALINETSAIVAVLRGSDKVHRVDSHVLLVTAGLAGDGRALAASLRSSCQRHVPSYGEPPTVHEVAHMASASAARVDENGGGETLGLYCNCRSSGQGNKGGYPWRSANLPNRSWRSVGTMRSLLRRGQEENPDFEESC
jgi:hypothetical protein